MRTIVEDLLILAKMDEGALVLAADPVDLTLLAGSVLTAMAPLAERRTFGSSCTDGPAVRIVGDADRLREVVRNLVDNAIKYATPEAAWRSPCAATETPGELTVANTGRRSRRRRCRTSSTASTAWMRRGAATPAAAGSGSPSCGSSWRRRAAACGPATRAPARCSAAGYRSPYGADACGARYALVGRGRSLFVDRRSRRRSSLRALARVMRVMQEFIDVGDTRDPVFKDAVEAALVLGDIDRAREIMQMVPRSPGKALADAGCGGGRLWRAHRRTDRPGARNDDRGFREAERLSLEIDWPFMRARYQLDHAEWLASQGCTDEAIEFAADAGATFRELRATPWLVRAESITSQPVEAAGG